jgi:hypothetical protein
MKAAYHPRRVNIPFTVRWNPEVTQHFVSLVLGFRTVCEVNLPKTLQKPLWVPSSLIVNILITSEDIHFVHFTVKVETEDQSHSVLESLV